MINFTRGELHDQPMYDVNHWSRRAGANAGRILSPSTIITDTVVCTSFWKAHRNTGHVRTYEGMPQVMLEHMKKWPRSCKNIWRNNTGCV